MTARFAASGVIIDLDGTLLDTAPDLVAATNAMREELGMAPLPAAQIVSYVGKGAQVLVHRALTERSDGVADAALYECGHHSFLAHYQRENGRSAALYPGVSEGLQAMRQMRLQLACVTNKPAAFTEPLLRQTGLRDYFSIVVSGDTYPKRKPDPMPMLQVALSWQIAPQLIVAIGDSINDAQAARAAGMRVFAVPYGYNEGYSVDTLDVDAVVSSLEQAAGLIRRADAAIS